MGNEKLCSCGSAADWAEVGSTWICVACRGREVNKNVDELKEALERLERAEKALRTLKVDTASIAELLGKLEAAIHGIVV
jgi:F0F1-type ATP synthase epsilon subunit